MSSHWPEAPPPIEVTVGVLVPMHWDQAAGKYVVASIDAPPSERMQTADGGLFSEALSSVWVPSQDEWVRCTDDDALDSAASEAWAIVGAALHAASQEGE